jgi:hypothetical protein
MKDWFGGHFVADSPLWIVVVKRASVYGLDCQWIPDYRAQAQA